MSKIKFVVVEYGVMNKLKVGKTGVTEMDVIDILGFENFWDIFLKLRNPGGHLLEDSYAQFMEINLKKDGYTIYSYDVKDIEMFEGGFFDVKKHKEMKSDSAFIIIETKVLMGENKKLSKKIDFLDYFVELPAVKNFVRKIKIETL